VRTQTATPPQPPADADGPRLASGTIFVIASAALAVGFVLFIIFVSPVLLERTQRLAPPPAPQTVASGELDGRTWSVEAYDATEGLRVPDADGIEPVIEPEPCARLDLGDGAAVHELCVERRGGSIRGLEAVVDPSCRALILGIVAPQVSEVTLLAEDGPAVVLTPAYVDFGFPLGFLVAEVDAATPYVAVIASDRDGEERARAECATDELPFSTCDATER
jgi:hypothetical protein